MISLFFGIDKVGRVESIGLRLLGVGKLFLYLNRLLVFF